MLKSAKHDLDFFLHTTHTELQDVKQQICRKHQVRPFSTVLFVFAAV